MNSNWFCEYKLNLTQFFSYRQFSPLDRNHQCNLQYLFWSRVIILLLRQVFQDLRIIYLRFFFFGHNSSLDISYDYRFFRRDPRIIDNVLHLKIVFWWPIQDTLSSEKEVWFLYYFNTNLIRSRTSLTLEVSHRSPMMLQLIRFFLFYYFSFFIKLLQFLYFHLINILYYLSVTKQFRDFLEAKICFSGTIFSDLCAPCSSTTFRYVALFNVRCSL